MKGKYIFVAVVILTFALVALKPIFCLAQIEDVGLEKQLKQIRECVQKGDNESAINLAEEYLKTEPNNIEVLVTLADSNSRIGKFTEAKEAAKKALSIEPTNVWALTTLAMIYRVEAEQLESVTAKKKLLNLSKIKVNEALKLEPEAAWANAEAALIYLAQGDKKRASKLIEKALELQPNEEYFENIKIKIESNR